MGSKENRLVKIAVKAKNSDKALAAVMGITSQELLAYVAESSSDKSAQIAAILRISDQELLVRLAENPSISHLQAHAIRNITDASILRKMICSAKNNIKPQPDFSIAYIALHYAAEKNIFDDDALCEIALASKNSRIATETVKLLDGKTGSLTKIAEKGYRHADAALTAAEMLTDEGSLTHVAMRCDYEPICNICIRKISNEVSLVKILKRPDIRLNVKDIKEAVDKIQSQELLNDIAKNAGYDITKLIVAQKQGDVAVVQEILTVIAKNTDDHGPLHDAVDVIDNQDILTELAINEGDHGVRTAAAAKLNDKETARKVLIEVMQKADMAITKLGAAVILDKYDDPGVHDLAQKTLLSVAHDDRADWFSRSAAAQCLDDKDIGIAICYDIMNDANNEYIKMVCANAIEIMRKK